MKPGVPWSVKGIDPEVRVAAKTAARRAGMTVGEWLNSVILDQNEHNIDSPLVQTPYPEEIHLSSAPQDPGAPRADSAARTEQPRKPPPRGRDDSALRLQDIARQLAELAQKERQSAAVQPLDARSREEGEEALARVLERIDDNERQTVEAFTAVNERLSVLGQQIAMLPRAQRLDRPEDVPGYSALESAIRNVVEHIEVSEKRTRDSLKAMQDRLAELAEEAARQPKPEDLQRTGPALASLEARVAELSNRLLRAEVSLQAGLPDSVRREFGQIAERIDSVKASADQMAKQAQAVAAGVARGELREIETRVLAMLQEAQATAAAQSFTPDIGELRGEIGGLSRRMDEIRAASASGHDLDALRIAVEQLSSRVAQVPDMRPLAEMDRRLGDLGRRIDQVAAATGGIGQVRDIEERLADLGRRVEEAMRHRSDPRALDLLERNIAAVGERVGRTEEQLRHIETMEQAIRALYDSLEQGRTSAVQAAEETAGRTAQRMPGSERAEGPSPELRALEDGLRAVRESAAGAERRNQETLAAVHETLSQIVEKIAELEAGQGNQAAPSQGVSVQPPAAEPLVAAEPQAGDQYGAPAAAGAAARDGTPLSTGDDFIAAARRAAQAAASRPSVLRAELGAPVAKPEEERGFSFFRKGRSQARADAGPAAVADAGRASRRRRLLLAGVVLLAAVSAFAFNMLVRKPAPAPAVPPAAIEAPAKQGGAREEPRPAPRQMGRTDRLSDPAVTGSAKLPPPETGTDALRSAAARGDARAQFIVAGRYLDGEGVPPDPAKAAFWYEQAAASGLAPAQYRLATLLERGKGVARDLAAALSWYERAARQGNVKSMHNAAVISLGGQVGQADHARAKALFTTAAEHGLRDSQFNLAILHERGLGTRTDKAEAYFWYRLAARQGDAQAAERAAVLARSLSGPEIASLDARLARWSPAASEDSANVVAVADPSWTEPNSSVLMSEAAVPLASGLPAGDLVTEAQHLLLALGFNVGTPDGKMGSRTASAIRLFQLQSGLEVTGEITPEVLNAMRAKAS